MQTSNELIPFLPNPGSSFARFLELRQVAHARLCPTLSFQVEEPLELTAYDMYDIYCTKRPLFPPGPCAGSHEPTPD